MILFISTFVDYDVYFSDYKDYCTDTTVRFVVKMSADNLSKAEQAGLHRTFKLQTTLSVSSMVWHSVQFQA